jgi:RimJ/RimL family protein N-acetyltransferase
VVCLRWLIKGYGTETLNYWLGEKIRLRAIELADAETILGWHEDSEVSRHMDFLNPPQSLESIKEFVGREALNKLDGDKYFWIIEDLKGNAVGQIDTRCNTRHGNFEYGVSVYSEFKRSGYASEAINKILDYYFNHLRYHKATAGVHSDNPPSIKLHERLGFQLEGSIREMIYSNGAYVDLLYYGMTSNEFQQR